ncbi:MAG: hypothetical protein QXL57_03530 [Candidatus Bathyarchaeia archaeon]
MNWKKYSISVCLSAIILALGFICVSESQSLRSQSSGKAGTSDYDPWLDVNDDGRIDGLDALAIWKAYGKTGDPQQNE